MEKVEIGAHSLQLKSQILFKAQEQFVRSRNGKYGLALSLEKISGAPWVPTNYILQLYVLWGLTTDQVIGG
jgi:hypothetical protein